MTTTGDILSRGYLPKELPPLFNSASLGQNFASLSKTSARDSYCLRTSYSKYSTVRRAIAIPNAAHFVPLAQAVSAHWQTLQQQCALSRFSHTKPVLSTDRAIAWEHSLDEMSRLRAELRVGSRYILQADVSSYYASIYTHSIPWALHTKPVAKTNRSTQPVGTTRPLPGNMLDLFSRNIQSGQTVGLPIGPDTSLPIAEAILASVDAIVEDTLRCSSSAFRFVDDYEIAFSSLAEAERAQNVLQDALAEYELELNPRKTRILTAPASLETPWVQELAAFTLGSPKPTVLEAQLIRYFSRAFDLANTMPGEPVLKYAVRRISEVDTTKASPIAQRLLCQAAVADPGCLQSALFITWQHKKNGQTVDTISLTRALEAILVRHAGLQHGGDIAWALWGAVVFGVSLGASVVSALEKLQDPVGILMTLFAEAKGSLASTLRKSQWSALIQDAQLFEKDWMVAYEAFGHGWLSSTADPASSDPFFSDARQKGVKFIDDTALLHIPQPSAVGEYE